ncbi:MAG: complex I NDUFA9 subunit family protein [Betaproteobacteria bacterium]
MKLKSILVLGGSGFIGRHIIAELARRVMNVTVPTRRRERAKHLILLPTVEVVEADILQPGVLERYARGSEALINLVGVLHSRRGRPDERGPNNYGPDFARAHVEAAQAAVRACRAAGIRRLVHVSAIGAESRAPSEYLRSKGIGEQAVRAAGDLDVTVFRPSVVFGPEDQFLNRFALLVKLFPVIGIPRPNARFQPVYVGDVARAVVDCLDEPVTYGQHYELAGPREYTMRELFDYVCRVIRRRRILFGLPDWVAETQARFLEMSPVPIMSRDNLRSMEIPSTTKAPFPFGMQPQSLEAIAPTYLAPHGPRERLPELRWRARR